MSKGKSRQSARRPGPSPKTGNLERVLEQGIAQLQKGELAAAEASFRHILTADPQHLDALQCLGVIEFQRARFNTAAELLQRAVSMAPEAAGLHCNLGLALQQLGRLEQALACQERALALKPGDRA